MSTCRYTVNANAVRCEQEQAQLWASSAFAALLVHLVPVALLVLYLQWPPRPLPRAGSPAAMDVELTSMPPAGPTAASPLPRTAPQPQTRQPPASRPQLAAVNPVLPLAQMQSIPQPEAVPSNPAPVAESAASSAPAESTDFDAPGTPDPGLQLWEDELLAQLARYKEYPRSAVKQMQQDTVKLHISVDPTGQVTYAKIDSSRHYPPLEQEVQRMLRLAGRLPAPPPQLANDAVVTVPVQFSLIQPKAAPARPTLASCTAAAGPGPAPAESTATVEQLRAYRESLIQYLAAAGNQLRCLSQVREAGAVPLRETLTRQLHSIVDSFNAETRVVEAKAQAQADAQALQAQQARRRQAQALAAQIYAACTTPSVSQPPGALNAKDALAFRRQLLNDQSAVRSYVACLQKADLAAAAPDRGLVSDQRAQLSQTALQLGNAAILAFNQVAGRFNAQVPQLRQQALAAQRQQALAKASLSATAVFANNPQEQQNLAEALVRAARIFPNSTWDVPAPLPPDQCFRVTQSGQIYQAQVCHSTYVTSLDASTQMAGTMGAKGGLLAEIGGNGGITLPGDAGLALATVQERIAAQHGVAGDPGDGRSPPILGIAVAPESQAGQQTGSSTETVLYSISDLHVAGRHVSLTINRTSPGGWTPVHLDLILSPGGQTLHGDCWTGQQRSECTLTRHASASGRQVPP